MDSFDVAIIGASLAGASAAIELGRAGFSVALIDKADFPRRKPCGEGLSAYGLKQLEYLGVKHRVLDLPHAPFHGYRILSYSKSSVIQSPWQGNVGIQRSLLDAELLARALQYPNVHPFLSERVTAVSRETVSLTGCSLRAKRIILACGSTSRLLEKLPCKIRRLGPVRAGMTATFKGNFSSPLRYVTIILDRGLEACCTPLAGGRLNVSLLWSKSNFASGHRGYLPPQLAEKIFEECSFNGEMELLPRGRANLGNVRRTSEVATIQLAGDALEEFDPIGGMGMSHALRSGICAAQWARNSLSSAAGVDVLRATSSCRADRSTNAMRAFTSITLRTMTQAHRFPIILPLAASPVTQGLMKLLTRELAC